MTRLDAMVAGELYVDLILGGFEHWPKPGEEAFANDHRREIGGGAAITACGLGVLGARTGVFGVVGADHHDWIAGKLEECEVDTKHLHVDEIEPTAFTVAVTFPEDRAFFTYLGANKHFPAALLEAVTKLRFSNAKHVHLACALDWDTAFDVFTAIRANGCTLSLDAGWHPAWLQDPRALDVLPLIDILFPNAPEAARMTGERDPEQMLLRFAEAGLRCVGLKLGSGGAGMLLDGDILFVDPLPVKPRDTTGAGDCFDAGFLYSWLRGEEPELWLQTANICGALSTEAFGGIAGFPTPERLKRELESMSWVR